MITAAQLRAARALLLLDHSVVEEATGLSKRYLSEIENEKGGKAEALNKLELFYVSRGLEFLDNEGVRKSPTGLRMLKGQTGFREMYEDIYETARKTRTEITLFNGVSQTVLNALGREFLEMHIARMVKIKDNFRFRVIVEDGDQSFLGSSYCEYRWFPSDRFNDTTVYTYGNKVAIVDFRDDIVITLIDQKDYAASALMGFDLAWDHIAKEPPHA